MPYTFTTREDSPLVGKINVRASADAYTLTAEFTEHRFSGDNPIIYTAPVVSNDTELTLTLTSDKVNELKSAYFRLRAVKTGVDIYLDDGQLQFTPKPASQVISLDQLGFDPATQLELNQAIGGKADLVNGVIPDSQIPSRLADASLKAAYVAPLPSAGSYTYNSDGTIASDPDGNTYTWNADGTPKTQTKNGVTRTFNWNADGTLASVN